MNKKVLVVAAHPDDELLGAGATIIKHVEGGDLAYCLILGQGVMARKNGISAQVDLLEQQARAAGKIIGFREMFFARFPDNAFDTVSLLEITQYVERIILEVKPDIVYTHHEYDLNVDHRLTFQAVLTACRPCNDNSPRDLLTFETLSSSEWQSKDCKQFHPNVYNEVTGMIDRKIEALRKYTTEIRPYPHPRSAEGVRIQAQYRGLEAGLLYAESFVLIRRINT